MLTLQEAIPILNQHKYQGRDDWFIHQDEGVVSVARSGLERLSLDEAGVRGAVHSIRLAQAIPILNKHRFRGRSDWIHCDEASRKHNIHVHSPVPDAATISPASPWIHVAAIHAIEAAEKLEGKVK